MSKLRKYIDNIHGYLKSFYDMALNPVKFEELKELAHGVRGKEIDRMLEEYRKEREIAEG